MNFKELLGNLEEDVVLLLDEIHLQPYLRRRRQKEEKSHIFKFLHFFIFGDSVSLLSAGLFLPADPTAQKPV